ncbi:LETM1 and EF-hand domain-containing protein 1, mitochondrial, partial [Fagus crenata]
MVLGVFVITAVFDKSTCFVLKYRPRLVNMCKYMGISPYGTDVYLRFMLRKRLQ